MPVHMYECIQTSYIARKQLINKVSSQPMANPVPGSQLALNALADLVERFLQGAALLCKVGVFI